MTGESVNGLTNKMPGEMVSVYPGYWRTGEKRMGDWGAVTAAIKAGLWSPKDEAGLGWLGDG